MLLSDSPAGRLLLKEKAWQHLQLTVPRNSDRPGYPNSPMGAVALLRQAMYDAGWYRSAWEAYRATPQLPRPETNLALDVLSNAIASDTFVIDAANERMAIRAHSIASEFSLRAIIRGSGREYRQLEEIAATNRPILVPVDFPDPPNVTSSEAARDTTLQELMHWDLAAENPARLAAAGVSFCLTTDGLDDVSDFLKQVRKAIDRGLPADVALAAVTTVPARLLGVEQHVGRVQPGMLANFLICDGDLLAEKTKILECWVAGEQFVISAAQHASVAEMAGTWRLAFQVDDTSVELQMELTQNKEKLAGVLQFPDSESNDPAATAAAEKGDSDENENDADNQTAGGKAADGKAADGKAADGKADGGETDGGKRSVKLQHVVRERDRMSATIDLHAIDAALPEGVSRLTLVTVARHEPKPMIFASLVLPDGQSRRVDVRLVEAEEAIPPGEDAATDAVPEDLVNADVAEGNASAESLADDALGEDVAKHETATQPTPPLVPLGAYGLEQPIVEQPTVMFRGATVWTCEQPGVLESADVLIRDGLIAEIGPGLPVPAGCQIVDARGKHITPGLIDCHSHMGTDGGVNESGQAVTAEVRIGDFIDNSDIQIYRQAAGGLTTSNILHGSANPIGGQNQVIKLRWGESMDGLRMAEAPGGIKFALGENVKRNQSRYPNTRMGVEQIIRDQLLAAREYAANWRRWRKGERDALPPRTDLQLEALAEVQRGERWIHCHSYRQDEIVATLDVLEEFGIQIGTLQHILEGYKVADRMAKHGAMGSSFSDWWAYKFEVFDAIPYNGALMHDRGVVVSFNSDDRELARHLNTEAAKATKYGGVPEIEALKFVTLNPAKQLRIDQYVGSLAVGKHADLVVWSGRPLSTLSRCEQTWIDGRRYFDLETDQSLRRRDAQLRTRLIQKALASGKASTKKSEDEIAEEDRWVRHDVYCAAHGAAAYDHTRNTRNR